MKTAKIPLSRNSIIISVGALILLASLGSSYYFWNQHQKTVKLLENPSQIGKEESKALIDKVGKLIELPKETPNIYTVTDVQKLKDQPFFARAENGDKVLIYTQAKKAILYRPSINKVIDVAPINIGEEQAQNQPTRIAIYNGTTTVGLTNIVEKQLKEKLTNIDVVVKENAGSNDYKKTVVVDLSGSKKDIATQIADIVKGELGTLPDDEIEPKDADILVILGATK